MDTRHFCCVLILVALFGKTEPSLPEFVRIGGVFETNQTELSKAFIEAVEQFNSNATRLLPSTLVPVILNVSSERLFKAARDVCSTIKDGVMALVGPPSTADPDTASLIRSAALRNGIPHVFFGQSSFLETQEDGVSFTLYPERSLVAVALRDLLLVKQWTRCSFVYETPNALHLFKEAIKLPNLKSSLLFLPDTNDFKRSLRELAGSGETNFIIDMKPPRLKRLLNFARGIGMVTEYHHYIFTSLDVHTMDMRDIQITHTNITAFELLVSDFWEENKMSGRMYALSRHQRHKIPLDVAMFHDAIFAVCIALQSLYRQRNIEYMQGRLSCEGDSKWLHGETITQHIRQLKFEGLTGAVQFDGRGVRTNATLSVVELKNRGLTQVGTWNLFTGINITRPKSTISNDWLQTLQNRTLRVAVIINEPYVMWKSKSEKLTGNDRFEGFCIDMLREIAAILNFRYNIRIVRDASYGSKNANGQWNGMIREVIDREVDFALGDLTISFAREEVVDFTMPFMPLGISILFKKIPGDNHFFFFLTPLSAEVWMCVGTAYVGVSVLMFVVSRISLGRSRCSKSTLKRLRKVTLRNAFWFNLTSIMRQGANNSNYPQKFAPRVLATAWWFFCFVVVSTYTATLASSLTKERLKSPIENAVDLAKQTDIAYGCVRSGSTRAFFQESKVDIYERMWRAMASGGEKDLVESNVEGIDRVLKGGYAFLMESTSIEYIVQRNCQLTQIGGLLDSKGYGIATPHGSPYTNLLSSAILKLQEIGTLHTLKNKWWKVVPSPCPRKSDAEIDPDNMPNTNSLGIAKVGGIFVILLVGLGVACIIAFLEFIVNARNNSNRQRRRNIQKLACATEMKNDEL